jgi:putative hemolysin
LPEDSNDYDTLGGLIIDQLGYIPKEVIEDEIKVLDLVMKIAKVEDNRIEKVTIIIQSKDD